MSDTAYGMTRCYPPEVVNRLKTARGHLDGILKMVTAEAYCPDVMKQIAAVQGVLEATTRLVLRKHLETCIADGVQAGRTDELINELMEALKFDRSLKHPTVHPAA
jgi:CsoR family transcriptional regulator, copper-sensing transcriptional repressor